MTDVEGGPENPYTGPPRNTLSSFHPFTIMKRLGYMGISLYGLKHFNFYRVVLHSPHVRHEWFKVGLASSIGA